MTGERMPEAVELTYRILASRPLLGFAAARAKAAREVYQDRERFNAREGIPPWTP